MSAFVVFTIVLTLLLVIYYGIMVALDLRKMGKKPSSNQEEFDVSSMQDQDESFSVDESQFALPDTTVQQNEQDVQDPVEEEEFMEAVMPSFKTPQYKPRSVVAVEEKMEPVEVDTTQGSDVDEFCDTLKQGDWMGPLFQPDKKKTTIV